RLGGMMLPELHPGMGPVPPRLELAKRRAVDAHRQDRAASDIDADADHLVWRDVAGGQRLGDTSVEDLEIVSRVLQRRVRRELLARGGKRLVNYAMGVAD